MGQVGLSLGTINLAYQHPDSPVLYDIAAAFVCDVTRITVIWYKLVRFVVFPQEYCLFAIATSLRLILRVGLSWLSEKRNFVELGSLSRVLRSS